MNKNKFVLSCVSWSASVTSY